MILKRKDLIESPVRFDEDTHTYTLGDSKLSGITGLIHAILGLGVYPEADEYAKSYLIPRAGSRGTAVHHAIQTYDEIGMALPYQYPDDGFGDETDEEGRKYWDVSNELESYIRHLAKGNFRPVANEYTVSDLKQYASQIDNVWQHKETEGIWLVDTKTNNTDLYPVCGYFNARYFKNGTEALKDYLSWQLSCYAYLFERQNPGIKVEGLASNWLRRDESAFWVIERKPDALVEELLKSEAFGGDNGWLYYHPNLELFGISGQLEKKEETSLILPQDVITYMSDLHSKVREYTSKLDEAKTALRKAMEANDVYKADLGAFSATLSADTTAKTFDTKRFKEENPELYKKYLVEKEKKGSLLLKFKDNE